MTEATSERIDLHHSALIVYDACRRALGWRCGGNPGQVNWGQSTGE